MTQSEAQRMLLEMLRGLKEDIAEEREASRQSRAAMRDRIEDVADRLAHIEATMAVAGAIDAQVRNELDALRAAVKDNRAAVQPTIDEWARVKLMGHGVVWTVGIAGAAFGASAWWFWDQIVAGIRALLRIP